MVHITVRLKEEYYDVSKSSVKIKKKKNDTTNRTEIPNYACVVILVSVL